MAFTCRHYGISRQTFYRWWRRYDSQHLSTLEARSHRPHHRRQPTWSAELADAVLALRRQFPRWGKDKLVVLVRRRGYSVSTSMIGCILVRLRQRRLLVEPPRSRMRFLRRARFRTYAARKLRSWCVSKPGDLVQVDTLDVRPLPGVTLKQFTARDVVSRWDVVEAHGRATSSLAAQFLGTVQQRMTFPIRAVQGDCGSEFAAEFE